MKKLVKFAVMQYIPSYERDEKINVGVILHSKFDNYLSMKLIDNWKRLKEFDDELDIEFVKFYLKTVKEQFSYNEYKLNLNNVDINDDMLLENMTKYYVNQFIFKIFSTSIDLSPQTFLEQLKKNFLYYDTDKKKRVSKKESLKFFEEILASKNVKYEVIYNKNSLIGKFNEKINVDMMINNKYYKLIELNDTNVSTYISTIKMWMLNAIELKEDNKELIFIVNEQVYDEKVKRIISMLESYSKVIKTSDFIDYFNN